ncbi:unnamed protein product [Lymnaea stagnalis]|uniref:CCDC66 domain-containing protein n=1 Tax=Lymnaea stagnalis TaxID=6523 RepID=A0AAV2ILJ3_LYMST
MSKYLGSSGAVQLAINKNLDGHGIFWQSKDKSRHEPKKFGYKTRKLRHPIRQPDEDEILLQMEVEKEEEKKKFNKNNKDFIRKNRERFKSKGEEQGPPVGTTQIKPGTVTLTQDQLTALLTSLGRVTGEKSSPLKINFDAASNKIQIEKLESDGNEDSVETGSRDKHGRSRDEDDSEIGIGALLKGEGKTRADKQREDPKERRSEHLRHVEERSEHRPQLFSKDLSKTETDEKSLYNIPWKHLTVGERKRLQWAREKAEENGEYNPWGRPGAGAPMPKQEEAHEVVMQSHTRTNKHNAPQVKDGVDERKEKQQDAIAKEIEKLQREIQEAERRKKAEEERILRELVEKHKDKVVHGKEIQKTKTEKIFEDKEESREERKSRDDRDDKVQMGGRKMKEENETIREVISDEEEDPKPGRGKMVSDGNLDVTRESRNVQSVTGGHAGPATSIIVGRDQREMLNKKEIERKKWLAELDKQREEQRMKKQLEKEKDKTGLHDQWADRFVYHKTLEQISPRQPQPIQRPRDQGSVQGQVSNASPETYAPPAAMRSSMVVGAGTLNDKRYDNTKAEEKRKWLQELEMQREEQRLAKLAQKERDKQEDGAWADHYPSDYKKLHPMHDNSQNSQTGGIWADPYPSDYKKLHPVHDNSQTGGVWADPYPSDYKKLHPVHDNSQTGGVWADPYPSDHKKLRPVNERLQNQQGSPRSQETSEAHRTNSAPTTTLPALGKPQDEPPTFLRGQGAFIDPVTKMEQEQKRKAQMEHQAEIKAQIEEKERKKREERERKIREDIEEERKLQLERDSLNKQTENEHRKIREREEMRQKQMAVIKTAMDEAQEKAQEDKNVRRIHHLQQLGHDVSQLKATYGAASPRKKEFEMTSIPGLGHDSLPNHTSRRQDQPSPSPHTQTERADHSERHHGQQMYSNEPYVEDRVLTPSRFRNPSRPRDLPDSPRREFGTQTLELKDLKAILQNLPDEVQIEYKMRVQEALKEKEKQPPPRKVHVKSAEESCSNPKRPGEKAPQKQVEKAPLKKVEKLPPKKVEKAPPKEEKSGERPDWNQRKRKTVVKNSEKDPFYAQNREEAEARRLKRERQLLYLQELNKGRIPSLSKSPGRSPRDVSPEAQKQVGERGRKPAPPQKLPTGKAAHVDSTRDTSPNVLSLLNDKPEKRSSPRSVSPPIPSVKHRTQVPNDADPYTYANSFLRNSQTNTKYGDAALEMDEFVPFLRTTEILDPSKANEPVAISRENSRMERARKAHYEGLHPANKGKKLDVYQDREREARLKNPLINPGLVTDHPSARQEMILQQLSSLKKTLMQRQKELEDYMVPSDLDLETARG